MKSKTMTGYFIKGPKKSEILDLELTKTQLKTVLKAAKRVSFTGEELKYQEDGLIFLKKKVTVDDILIGAFIRQSLESYVKHNKGSKK